MIDTLNTQGSLFMKIILMGVVIAFFYDIIRFFRQIVPHRYYALQVENILYWLWALFAVFSFFIRESYGEIRFFSVFALLSGMLIYFFFISPYFMKICSVPADFIKNTFIKIGFCLNTAIKKYSPLRPNKKNILHFPVKCAKIKFNKK